MIYNLVLRGEYTTHLEIKWGGDDIIEYAIYECLTKSSPALRLVSTDGVLVIIPYEVLSNNIIEVYENG